MRTVHEIEEASATGLVRRTTDIDLRTLPLDPEEAFVLSRIDGVCSRAEVVLATGLAEGVVRAALARLQSLGAIADAEAPARNHPTAPSPRHSARPPSGEPAASGASAQRPRAGTVDRGTTARELLEDRLRDRSSPRDVRIVASEERHPLSSLPPPSEPPAPEPEIADSDLDATLELSLELQREVLARLAGIDHKTHYEMLDVTPTAAREAIKDSYFASVGRLHPDRHYGKRLGAFKEHLDRLFARLTEAYDVLSRKKRRLEYDAYLATRARRVTAESQLAASDRERELEVIQAEIEAEAERLARARTEPPPGDAGAREVGARFVPDALRPPRVPTISGVTASPAARVGAPTLTDPAPPIAESASPPRRSPVVVAPSPEDERRRALARRFGDRQASSDRPSMAPEVARTYAADDLRRRLEAKRRRALEAQVQRYVDQADAALRERNPIAETNSLRIAVSLDPADEALRARLTDAEGRAASVLFDTYLEQARYEEKNERWAEAARSYAKLARARKLPRDYDRAAALLLKAGGDLKSAADHARTAVQLDPNGLEYRLTLIEVYVAAGLVVSARAEIQRAREIAPADDRVKQWLQRLKGMDA